MSPHTTSDCRRRPRRPDPGAAAAPRSAALRVLVCEKRQHPVPEAAFKVGESTVEIGAHYFQDDRRSRAAARARPAAEARPAIFLSRTTATATSRAASSSGRRLPAGAVVPARSRTPRELAAADGARRRHRRARRLHGPRHRARRPAASVIGRRRRTDRDTVQARWLVDASGRAGLLEAASSGWRARSRTLANACWFRFPDRLASTTGPTTRPGRPACRRASAG